MALRAQALFLANEGPLWLLVNERVPFRPLQAEPETSSKGPLKSSSVSLGTIIVEKRVYKDAPSPATVM